VLPESVPGSLIALKTQRNISETDLDSVDKTKIPMNLIGTRDLREAIVGDLTNQLAGDLWSFNSLQIKIETCGLI
jgi:hypothetical protein